MRPRIRLNQLSHVYRRSDDANEFELDGCSNHVAAACAINSEIEPHAEATGMIRFENADGTYSCTGTLLNDNTVETWIPFFLTANHCINNQEVADTIEVRWNYRTAECSTKQLNEAMYTLYGGAYLVTADPGNDMSLIRFKWPLQRKHWFVGWSTNAIDSEIGDTAYVFHHPLSQEQQYGTGQISSIEDVSACDEPTDLEGCAVFKNAIKLSWTQGVGEVGSSGAGLFHDECVIGVLSDGGDQCMDAEASFTSLHQSADTIGPVLFNESNDDHGDTHDTATHVSLSSWTDGWLDGASDVDVFRFEVRNDAQLTIYTTGDTDTTGRLHVDSGQVENDDGGEGSNFKIVEEVSPGTYFVEVTPFEDDSGEYVFQVDFAYTEIGDSWQDAFKLDSLPFSVPTAIDTSDDIDWYLGYVREKGTLHLQTRGTTDTVCEIRVTSTSKLKSYGDDDSGVDQNCHVQMTVVPDWYYFNVAGNNGATGEYEVVFELQLEDDHGNATESATNVSTDSDHWEYRTYAHLDEADVDYFKLDLKYDGDLSTSSQSDLDLTAELFNENEESVIFNDDSGEGRNFGFTVNVEKGVYYLKVEGYFDEAIGPYVLDVNFEETF